MSFATDENEDTAATHYVSAKQKSSNRFTKAIREHFTAGGLNEKLLRKTTKKNTWIYVAVSSCPEMMEIYHLFCFQDQNCE